MGCKFTVERSGNLRVLQLEGNDFAMPQLAEFRTVLARLMQEDPSGPLAMDTTGLALLGSCCLAGIIDYALGFRKQATAMFLVETRSDILDVFQVASLGSILPIYGSVEEGVSALKIS